MEYDFCDNTTVMSRYGTSGGQFGQAAAGYVAAVNGISWEASRIAFDYYQG